jgi:hypothetical protein
LVVIRSCKATAAPGKGLGDDAVRERHRIRQHRGMRGEIGKAHFRAHRQWMIGRDHHMQRVVPEWRGTQRWLRWAERGQGEFGAALQDPRIRLLGIHETQVQRHPRVQRAETAQQVRKPMQADVVAGGEAEAAADVLVEVIDRAASGVGFGEHLFRAWQQQAAGFGEQHLAAEAVEQARAQRSLQQRDALAHRWLGQVQLRGRRRRSRRGRRPRRRH